jgi:hypothetical protein
VRFARYKGISFRLERQQALARSLATESVTFSAPTNSNDVDIRVVDKTRDNVQIFKLCIGSRFLFHTTSFSSISK